MTTMTRWTAAAALLLSAAPALAGNGLIHDDVTLTDDAPEERQPARRVDVTITDDGPQPGTIAANPNERLQLMVTRRTDRICKSELAIPAYDFRTPLPLGQAVPIAVTTSERGPLHLVCPVEDGAGEVDVR